MAYDVVKTIKGRQYRYSVESYRDPQTGRVKNRWTYAGKIGDTMAPKAEVKRRAPAPQTRQRLIDAFLSLVDHKPWAEVTPGAVAAEAGLAHGTFYRYFKNRSQLFVECTRRANDALDARLRELALLGDSLAGERARLRAWTIDLIERPTSSPGLLRVWMEMDVTKLRETRRAARVEAFSRYIHALRAREFVPAIGEVRPLAIALSFLVESLARRTVAEQTLLSEDDYAAAREAFDRLIFYVNPDSAE